MAQLKLIFLFKLCIGLKLRVSIGFDRIKTGLKSLWVGVISKTWAELSLEPSVIRERTA
jgi:hypothetical protein